jgi:hypothetical protein
MVVMGPMISADRAWFVTPLGSLRRLFEQPRDVVGQEDGGPLHPSSIRFEVASGASARHQILPLTRVGAI